MQPVWKPSLPMKPETNSSLVLNISHTSHHIAFCLFFLDLIVTRRFTCLVLAWYSLGARLALLTDLAEPSFRPLLTCFVLELFAERRTPLRILLCSTAKATEEEEEGKIIGNAAEGITSSVQQLLRLILSAPVEMGMKRNDLYSALLAA